MERKLYDKLTNVLMTQKMADDLLKLASDEKTTMSNIIRSLLEKELERREERNNEST